MVETSFQYLSNRLAAAKRPHANLFKSNFVDIVFGYLRNSLEVLEVSAETFVPAILWLSLDFFESLCVQ